MKILIIVPRFPYPLTKGDRVRSYNQIRILSENNEIYLFSLSHKNVSEEDIIALQKYCKKIYVARLTWYSTVWGIIKSFFTGKPLQIGYYFRKKSKKQFLKFEKEVKPERIYCQIVRTFEYVRDTNIPIVLDFADAVSKNMERREKAERFYWKAILNRESNTLIKYEDMTLRRASETIIICEADRKCIQSALKDKIHIIANGVNFDYYQPNLNAEKKYDIVFAGTMSYAPNVNAAIFLVKKIMPLVWKKNPNVKVLIAGDEPIFAVRALHSKNVEVSGWVSDMRECYLASKMLVAPLQIGSGLQNKLLESSALQIPCITSPLANSSFLAKDREQVLIANTAQEYADLVLELLNNPEYARQLAQNAYKYVIENYSWQYHTKNLEKIIHNAQV